MPTQSMYRLCSLNTWQGHAETRQKEAPNWALLSRSMMMRFLDSYSWMKFLCIEHSSHERKVAHEDVTILC